MQAVCLVQGKSLDSGGTYSSIIHRGRFDTRMKACDCNEIRFIGHGSHCCGTEAVNEHSEWQNFRRRQKKCGVLVRPACKHSYCLAETQLCR